MTIPPGNGEQLAVAAGRLVGTPFRLYGRDPAIGLDCVGLISASLTAIGRTWQAPEGYRLRNSNPARWFASASASGLVETHEPIRSGDVVLLQPGPGQHHLAVITYEHERAAIVHAHAGLRRVVRQTIDPTQCFAKTWRLPDLEI